MAESKATNQQSFLSKLSEFTQKNKALSIVIVLVLALCGCCSIPSILSPLRSSESNTNTPSNNNNTVIATNTPAPLYSPTPIPKVSLTTIKDKLVSILENNSGDVKSVDKATATTDMVVIEAKSTNWVRSIIENAMYENLQEFANSYVTGTDMVDGNPKITLKFYSAIDGSSLQTTTDWTTIIKIKNKELSYDDWKAVNSAKVQGDLY